MTYKPLPPCVTIRHSEIEGLGLFATEGIPAGHVLGIAHIADARYENGYIRTPLGGFFNHSDDPNCEAYLTYDETFGEVIKLATLKDIKAGEELTAFYWLYEIKEGSATDASTSSSGGSD